MKRLLSLLIFVSTGVLFAEAQTYDFSVTITGFESNGKAIVMLYEEGQNFDANSEECKKAEVLIENKQCEYVFSGLAKGNYALMVFHDQNENGVLDTNFIGMPKEGVGTSRNHKGMPSFEKSKVYLDEDKEILISIKYL